MNKSTDELQSQLNKITNLNKYLQNNRQDLIIPNPLEYIIKLAKDKEISKAELVRNSQLERSYAYHLLEGSKKLTREKALALAFGARLSQEETQSFLKYAQLPKLYPRNQRDSVILYCLKKGFSLIDANLILADLKFEPIV